MPGKTWLICRAGAVSLLAGSFYDEVSSCAGLTRASMRPQRKMDCRVKPGNDERRSVAFTYYLLRHGVVMAGVDEKKQFVPLKIAVLTISDTRSLKDDKSGALLVQRIVAAGHVVAERSIVTDDVEAIRARVKAWIDDPVIDVVITTGGTGFTGRDVTPEAVEPLFEKKMDAFSALFLVISFPKIGTSAIQSRATAGVAGSTFIFCLPGSPGACKDAWDEILVHQLDYRYGPCNFVEIMPRLDEHLRRPKAQGATA